MCNKNDLVMEIKHLSKHFPSAHGKTLIACNDINLDIYKGRTLGVVGESGCGKSTLVRMITQLEKPTSGEILYNGKNIADFNKAEKWEHRKNVQMVFQDPSAAFNPKMKIKDIVTEPLLNYGTISRNDVENKASELLKSVDLPEEFIYRYPHSLSGGQRQRVAIARAIALNPQILVCDEATSALDVSVQDTIIELLVNIQKKNNTAMIFICHDIALIRSFAHDIAVMYLGNVVELIPAKKAAQDAIHPYTRSLINAQFSLNISQSDTIETLKGDIPSPLNMPKGCPFSSRCPKCSDVCRDKKPELKKIGERQFVACHLV